MKKIENEHGARYRELVSKYEKAGGVLDKNVIKGASREAMLILTQDYVQAKKFDEIIEYLLREWDAGGGYIYFDEVSEGLLSLGEIDRLTKMWTVLIGYRKRNNSRDESLLAMNHFLDVLQKVGDADRIRALVEEIELFASEKKGQFPDTETRDVSEESFWDIIGETKKEALHPILRAEVLEKKLLRFPPSELEKFEVLFQEKMDLSFTWDLWAIAYMCFDGCSSDGFEEFRAWLISEGKDVFESLVSNPESIVNLKLEPRQLEPLLYVTQKAYRLKTRRNIPGQKKSALAPRGDRWLEDENELKLRYPRIWKYLESVK